jgi:hypothetical protein
MKRLLGKLPRTGTFATLALVGAIAVPLALACAADAAIVTVGSTGTPIGEANVGATTTIFNTTLSEPGASLTSPISGTVIRWHVSDFSGGPFALQVLTPDGGASYTATGTSAPVTPSSRATQTFSTQLPIQAGQTLAIENANPTDLIGYLQAVGAKHAFITPPLADGATATATPGAGLEFTYNAEVQPLPGISAISPLSGPTAGGTPVLISGHDLTDATAVTFGGAPATSFSVVSETTLTATAPAQSSAGPVTVSVTTLAGSADSPSQFSYVAPTPAAPAAPAVSPAPPAPTCKVPKLKGKTLKSAKKRIRAADCGVGKLTKKEGATAKDGEVVRQVPKPGTTVPIDTKVKITLAL